MNAPIHQVNLLGERDISASIFDLNATQKLEQLFLAYYDPNADKNALKKQILAIMKTAFDKRIKQIEEIVQSEERNPAIKQRERAKQQQNILNYKQYIQSLEQLYKHYAQNDFHTDKGFLYRFFFAPVFAQGGFWYSDRQSPLHSSRGYTKQTHYT